MRSADPMSLATTTGINAAETRIYAGRAMSFLSWMPAARMAIAS